MWIKHPNNRIAVYVPDAPEQGRAEVKQAKKPTKKTGKKSSKKS